VIVVKINLTCSQCGGAFERYPSQIANGRDKFCSRECLHKWLSRHRSGEQSFRWTGWDERECQSCGRIFKVKRWKKQRFCSPECQHKWLAEFNKGKAYLLRYRCFIPSEVWKLAYFAGLLDGEGNIREIDHRIYIGNTDMKMIEWLKENFGGTVSLGKKRKPNWKPCHRWEAHSIVDCQKICQAVLPYLITKREQAQSLLLVCNTYLENFKGEIRCVY